MAIFNRIKRTMVDVAVQLFDSRLSIFVLRQLSVCLVIVSALASAQAFAEETPYRIEPVQPPEMLFHWTSFQSLHLMAAQKGSSPGHLSRFPTRKSSLLESRIRNLDHGAGVLFAWTDAATGMSGGSSEWYGDALLSLKIKPGARAIKFDEWTLGVNGMAQNVTLEGVDVLLHDAGLFKEWVILNPDAVEWASADPDVLKPHLQKALTELSDPRFLFQPEQLHFVNLDRWNNETNRNVAKERIENSISLSRSLAPTLLLSRPSVLSLPMELRLLAQQQLGTKRYLESLQGKVSAKQLVAEILIDFFSAVQMDPHRRQPFSDDFNSRLKAFVDAGVAASTSPLNLLEPIKARQKLVAKMDPRGSLMGVHLWRGELLEMFDALKPLALSGKLETQLARLLSHSEFSHSADVLRTQQEANGSADRRWDELKASALRKPTIRSCKSVFASLAN